MTDDEPDNEEEHLSLVMPFVVCQSEGGPYDDESFAAGWECGRTDLTLAYGVEFMETTVRVASVPQLDLIAMGNGYQFEWDTGDEFREWTTGTFRPTEDQSTRST